MPYATDIIILAFLIGLVVVSVKKMRKSKKK